MSGPSPLRRWVQHLGRRLSASLQQPYSGSSRMEQDASVYGRLTTASLPAFRVVVTSFLFRLVLFISFGQWLYQKMNCLVWTGLHNQNGHSSCGVRCVAPADFEPVVGITTIGHGRPKPIQTADHVGDWVERHTAPPSASEDCGSGRFVCSSSHCLSDAIGNSTTRPVFT